MANNIILATALAFSVCGCASPAIILKTGKSWQVLQERKNVPCIVECEDGVKREARCTLSAGDYVVPGGRVK